MIDISMARRRCTASRRRVQKFGLEINLEQIPCWENVAAMAAVASGEEFELLCTMPPTFGDAQPYRHSVHKPVCS